MTSAPHHYILAFDASTKSGNSHTCAVCIYSFFPPPHWCILLSLAPTIKHLSVPTTRTVNFKPVIRHHFFAIENDDIIWTTRLAVARLTTTQLRRLLRPPLPSEPSTSGIQVPPIFFPSQKLPPLLLPCRRCPLFRITAKKVFIYPGSPPPWDV